MRPFEREARQVVQHILESHGGPGLPVTIQTSDGQTLEADFNGYYDFRQMGKGIVPSIGYPDGKGSFSHGRLHPGDKLLTPIPSYEEWLEQRAKKKQLLRT